MALSYTAVDIRGNAFKDVLGEILFENGTLAKKLVTFADGVKANTIFTDFAHTVALQAYTSGAPTASGTMAVTDKLVTPQKFTVYDTFAMNDLRFGRFGRDMKGGAWENDSADFTSTVLNGIAPAISSTAESAYWNSATAATKTAVAALTAGTGQTSVGTAEKVYVAAAPASSAGLFDGVVTQMIYNGGAVGARVKVAGTTIDATNIFAEYTKAYGAIPGSVLHSITTTPYFYAPYSHLAFIRSYNQANTYKSDVFLDKDGKITFNGIEIVFVPLPENCIIVGSKVNFIWATDTTDDLNYVKIDKMQANADTMFYKTVFTMVPHIRNQKFNVLYLG
jgi:hypothetical protein